MSANFVKVSKASFSTGTVSLYVNVNGSSKNREIEGKVVMKLHYPSFMKGTWIKLLGSNSLSSERNGLLSYDLFTGEEEHHRDGLHQVLIGFGEGDNSHGAYLELGQGRHSWPFHFRLPHHAPATYFDGSINVSYRLMTIVESPIIQTASGRIVLNHDWLVPCYSNYSYVRIKETHITENKELLQKSYELSSSQQTGTQSGGILPSILSMVRTPTQLSIRGNPTQNIGAGTGASSEHCAMFPFQNKEHQYEVLCSISNLRCKQAVQVKTELYVEICTRSNVKHPYPSVYPTQIGQPNADEVSANNALLRSHTATTTYLVWEGATEVEAGATEQQIVVKVPIIVDTNPRTAALNHKPQPYALQPSLRTGKIVHYTMEGPLFRYRTMLKVSLVKSDAPNQTLCAPVFGEIYILPPRPEVDTSSVASVSSAAAVAAPVPRAPRRSNTSLAVRTDESAVADSEEETLQPSPVNSNNAAVSDSAPSRVRRFSNSADLETPRTLPQMGVVARAPSGPTATVTFYEDPVAAPPAVALAPTRPMSGHGPRPSRTGRNAGGIASFRAQNGVRTTTAPAEEQTIIAVPVGASAGGENAHPNVATAGGGGNKTPHAKPTKSSHIIRVDAELLSRGPAAVVIDRNERRHDPIRTPQRFALMYQLGTATVIDGTPVVIAPTPVMINTAEFRANRRNFAHYPLNTVERGARLATNEPETPRCLAEGFQYNCAVDSNMGTPEPPRRYSDSISESFDGQMLFGAAGRDVSQASPAIALPLPAESEHALDESQQQLLEAMHGATPRQRQLFRGTFDGVDWLALNHTSSAGALETLPNTSRTEVHNTNDELLTSRTVEDGEAIVPTLMLPTTPARSTSGMLIF